MKIAERTAPRRLERAERERSWALVSAHAEGMSIPTLAAAGLSSSRVHQITSANSSRLNTTGYQFRYAFTVAEDSSSRPRAILRTRRLLGVSIASSGSSRRRGWIQ
jgi:hypothetical protein